jgi:hypothetical protein
MLFFFIRSDIINLLIIPYHLINFHFLYEKLQANSQKCLNHLIHSKISYYKIKLFYYSYENYFQYDYVILNMILFNLILQR